MYEIRPAARTDQFRCPRCRQRECDYYELQIRSADEPMTCFVTCLNPKCGHKFKR
jgi:transcription elongation factor S-II